MAVTVFSVPIFLVVFRETIEAAIIISVLLAFLKQTFGGSDKDTDKTVYRSLLKQVSLQITEPPMFYFVAKSALDPRSGLALLPAFYSA